MEEEEQDLPALTLEKQEVMEVDTSEEFAQVFGSKIEFDSWDEFTILLEEFQKKTGSSFKPRSASSVEYANERRINGPIHERFVYANVKMICVHFGLPTKRASTNRKSYVGKGCGAFMNVSYNRGALRITQSHLIHNNHPVAEGEPTPTRQLRVFNFTDDLDLIIAREVINCNPFEYTNGEKKWLQVVDNLKKDDERLAHLTPRLVKKRIRLLVDKFLAINHGRQPSSEDEMGNILYELDRTRKDTRDNPAGRGRRRGPGRPRKKRNMSPYLEDDQDIEGEDSLGEASSSSPSRKRGRPTTSASPSHASADINNFLTFLQRKDEQDRKMRQQEIDLRKEELVLQKREMELQKQRFELDKVERKAHIELISAQMRALESSVAATASVKPQAHLKEATGQVEYTIVVDNNNQVLEAVPNLAVT